MIKKYNKGYTTGVFDLFHVGHLNILKKSKELCNHLVVGVTTDELVSYKNTEAFVSFEERIQIVESIKYVDMVIPENNWEQKILDIKEYDVDTFVMGDDWEGKFDFLNEYCEVVYLPRTKDISTTQLKASLKSH